MDDCRDSQRFYGHTEALLLFAGLFSLRAPSVTAAVEFVLQSLASRNRAALLALGLLGAANAHAAIADYEFRRVDAHLKKKARR